MRVSAVLDSGIKWSSNNITVYDAKGDEISIDYVWSASEIFMDQLVDRFYYNMDTHYLALWLKEF